MSLSEAEHQRYARHLLLPGFEIEQQERLKRARVLVIGAGGLGSPLLLYLAGAGVGHITVMDHDRVDLTNLQRQIAHTGARLGQNKADSARTSMLALNPEITVQALAQRAEADALLQLALNADLLVDCSDNFATRQAANRAAWSARIPLVSGAAIRFEGLLSVFDARHEASPCYACLFRPDANFEDVPCAIMGVFAPLVGMIGAAMAAESLKLLTGIGTPLIGKVLMLDAKTLQWETMRLARDPACPVCG